MSTVWNRLAISLFRYDCSFLVLLIVFRFAIPSIPRIRLAGRDTVGHAPLSLCALSCYGGQNPTSCAVRNCWYNIRAVVIFEALDVFDHFASLRPYYELPMEQCNLIEAVEKARNRVEQAEKSSLRPTWMRSGWGQTMIWLVIYYGYLQSEYLI